MLRITTHNKPGSLTFQLEGRLAGAWVRELQTCWQDTLAGHRPAFHVDLTAVTFIDARGKELLADMYRQGAELIAADCLTKAIVAEIVRSQSTNSDLKSQI